MSQGLCQNCGASVNLTAGKTETTCQYCDSIVTLQQAEATFAEVRNSKVGGTLLIAQTSQEGGNFDEAIAYYNKIIEQQPDNAEAWLNKGSCMVATSTIKDIKIREAGMCWKTAIKFAKNPDAMKKRVSAEINNVVTSFYPTLENYFVKTAERENAVIQHYERFILLESALDVALTLNPQSVGIAQNGLDLCDAFLASIPKGYGTKAAGSEERIIAEENRKAELRGKKPSELGNAIMTMGVGSAIAKAGEELANKLRHDLIPVRTKYLTALENSAGASHPSVVKAKAEIEADTKKRDQLKVQEQKTAAAENLEIMVEAEACKTLLGRLTAPPKTRSMMGAVGAILFLAIPALGGVLLDKLTGGLQGSDDVTGRDLIFIIPGGPIGLISYFLIGSKIRKPIRARIQSEMANKK